QVANPAPDLGDIAEAGRRQKARLRSAPGDQDVRRQGRPVNEALDPAEEGLQGVVARCLLEHVEHSPGWIISGGRGLVEGAPVFILDQAVGESATDVDRDPHQLCDSAAVPLTSCEYT